MINGWLFFHHGREVFNFRGANTYMLWKLRWQAGSAPGPWGPPGWRCTPPLASGQSAQRKWWCWAAARSSLHHCPASSQTQSHAWGRTLCSRGLVTAYFQWTSHSCWALTCPRWNKLKGEVSLKKNPHPVNAIHWAVQYMSFLLIF